MSTDQTPAETRHPRLTIRGHLILASTFLTVGPTVSFALGIPVNFINQYVVSLASGIKFGEWGANGSTFWVDLLMSPLMMIIGLPFYGFWAETHLVHLAGWIGCVVVLLATSRRGLHVGDAALTAAAIVLVFPFLVAADSPLLTWGYPDAVFMAVPAAGGAALCAMIVRGWGPGGLRRRIAWGWLN